MLRFPSHGFAFLFFCFLCAEVALSQPPDSLRKDSLSPAVKKKISVAPAVDFDQRFSWIRGKPVNIWGERAGIIIRDRVKVGFGGYYSRIHFNGIIIGSMEYKNWYGTRDMVFGTAYVEPFLFRKKYWELSFPFEFGYGHAVYKIYDLNTNDFVEFIRKPFFPGGAGISLSLKMPAFFGVKPFTWVGINFLAGYRYDFLEASYGTHFDGSFWSVSGAIFLDRAVKDLSGHKRKKKARK
ncbi:MAG: hypothetical protein HY063_01360 [Bacteroidetes bacterium]|nr:hypothetical protein [Bacteroidota bacterium]